MLCSYKCCGKDSAHVTYPSVSFSIYLNWNKPLEQTPKQTPKRNKPPQSIRGGLFRGLFQGFVPYPPTCIITLSLHVLCKRALRARWHARLMHNFPRGMALFFPCYASPCAPRAGRQHHLPLAPPCRRYPGARGKGWGTLDTHSGRATRKWPAWEK